MRVHEFAKQYSLTSKKILNVLEEEGITLKSHMSVLPEDALVVLRKNFKMKGSASLQAESKVQRINTSETSNKKIDRYAPLAKQEEEKITASKDSLVVRPLSVSDFAEKVGLPVNDVIITLLKQGNVCAKNYLLSVDLVKQLCQHYEIEAKISTQENKNVLSGKLTLSKENEQNRRPVVVVMGHVDHGKTTLLDYIRKARVAAKEKGGITQHLGAYSVSTGRGDLVFLDTPGHEAFSKIRKRGASVADIAILVIAADDGIMPQTLESIKAIKALEIPVIVAINKIDRVDEQRIEVVKRQLTQHDMLSEEWGGDTICVSISAKEGKGIDHLLEMIILQAEMMELKASKTVPAQGYILESRMLKGRGSVATLLCRQGTLRVGDYLTAGAVVGKVTTLTDSFGKQLKEAGPSTPILATGFSELPAVGELFKVVPEEEYRKARASQSKSTRVQQQRIFSEAAQKFNLILKVDTRSSLEALQDSFKKFPQKTVKDIVLIRSAVGNISESDALLAENTGSTIIGFNVKAEQNAILEIQKSEVKIHLFGVIYKLLEELEKMAELKQEVKMELTKIGQATVLKVFKIKKIGVIAGCIVNDGLFSAKGIVVAMRNKQEIGRGKIKSLQREKKIVKEVHSGFECGFIVDGFEDWQEDDIAECYINKPTTMLS